MSEKGTMTARQRLIHLLFERKDRVHRDIKFMRGDQQGINEDDFYDAVSSALVRQRTGVLKPLSELPRSNGKIKVKDFVEAL